MKTSVRTILKYSWLLNLLLWQRPGQLQAQSSPSPYRTRSGDTASLPPLFGKKAPGFTIKTLDGKLVSLSDYRGKAVVVNFWATWCGACKIEMPWLAELREKYKGQGFEVLGVLTNDASPETIATTLRKYGWTIRS